MSAELMTSKFIRLWNRLSLNLQHGFLSNFISWLPWAICPGVFRIKKKMIFYVYFFVFVNMGPYGRKTFKTLPLLQIALESFQTFPEFSSQCSSQSTSFGFFWVTIFFNCAWLCQHTSWNRNLFIVRPSSVVRVAIISEPIEQIPSPGKPTRRFLNFWRKKCIFKIFRIFFRFR